MSKVKIGGIMQSANLAKIGVLAAPDRPGISGAALATLGEAEINVQFIVQLIGSHNQSHLVLCVADDDGDRATEALRGVQSDIGADEVIARHGVSIVSIFGPDFREIPGISGQMFSALASVGINIQAISTSISTISCVIDAVHMDEAVRALTQTFELP